MANLADKLQLASQLEEAGELDRARDLCRQILDRHPGQADALNLLGIIAHKQGNAAAALDSLGRAARASPANPFFRLNLGIVQAALGRLEAAAESYREALQLNPDLIQARFNLAACLCRLGRYEEGITQYREVLRIRPDHFNALVNCGDACLALDAAQSASDLYAQALVLRPASFEIRSKLGRALFASGDSAHGIAEQREALAAEPRYVEGWHHLGISLIQDGRLEEAREAYREVLRLSPNHVAAHCALAKLSRYRPGDPAVAAMENLLKSENLPEEDLINLCFGLGKVYEDCGEFDQAFACFERGNRLKRKQFEYRIADAEALFRRQEELFDAGFFAQRGDYGDPVQRPIFILGMPRSGTTLVEQILCSHPLVFGAGEIKDLSQVLFAPGSGLRADDYPAGMEQLGRADAQRLAADYLQKIQAHAPPGKPHVTNKMPSNFVFIGAIKLLFPDARIVHCRRDPVDTCLSCYKQLFAAAQPFAYDLTELGRFYRLYERLMTHWHRVLPGAIYDVRYEELVDDPEEQTRALLAYCGLPFDPICLDFHRAQRQVKTASVTQVRRPLYRDAVQRWKSYEAHLGPLLDALAGRT